MNDKKELILHIPTATDL